MNNKFKNIVTNILGMIFFGIGTYYAVTEPKDYKTYIILIIVGLILFVYKISETKAWINKFLNKKIENQ